MSKNNNVIRMVNGPQGAPKPLTEEQKAEQMQRAFMQQYNTVAQSILFNICGGTPFEKLPEADSVANYAHTLAREFILKSAPSAQETFDTLVKKMKDEAEAEKKEGE